MNKIYFEVEDNGLIKHTPMPEIGENTYKTEVVITKEIFQECYKKWVEPQEKCGIINKIREIVAEWNADTWTDGLSYDCMRKIANLMTESEE